jgi:lysophospholipase L1-like esterase
MFRVKRRVDRSYDAADHAMSHPWNRRSAKSVAGFAVFLMGLSAAAGEPPGKAGSPPFELRDGDRVVLLGSGLIEQERRYGYLETRWRRRLPDGSMVFRNLGWAGDTVRGIARTSGFQNPEGFARLIKEVQDYKPTVLLIGYGTNESFEGAAGLAGFVEDYARLLAKLAPFKARVVLLSVTYQEDLGRPFPDPTAHNRDVDKYNLAIHRLAEANKLPYVELVWSMLAKKRAEPQKRLTTNGLQFNEYGSQVIAKTIEERLGLSMSRWAVKLDAAGTLIDAEGATVGNVVMAKDGIRFRAKDKMLAAGDGQYLKVVGLAAGEYVLKMDSKELLRASARDWGRGVTLVDDLLAADAEPLRQAIIANNELFYRRWRPFNDHSRHWGFIGGDGKLYDQEMAAQEKIIAERLQPRTHEYEIVRTGESK